MRGRWQAVADAKQVERLLSVGAIAMFHTEPHRKDGPRFKTVFRGWRAGQHILLDRPKAPSGHFAPIQEAQECVMRYLLDGLACAFDAQVIDWDTRRHNPYMRITWPQEIQHMCFRRFERVRVTLPCKIRGDDGAISDGEVRDLSMGGCGVFAAAVPKESSIVALTFQLPDGTRVEGVRALVRNVRPTSDGAFLGCEYCEGQPEVEGDINFFVTTTLDQRRENAVDAPSAPRVLVVDDDSEIVGRLRKNFEVKGIDFVHASNTVDGMYRLRMSKPAAVVVSHTLGDLPGLEVCRLIKLARDFQDLPVYLYGGDAPELPERAGQIGVTRYFPPTKTMAPDIGFHVSKQIAEAQKQNA